MHCLCYLSNDTAEARDFAARVLGLTWGDWREGLSHATLSAGPVRSVYEVECPAALEDLTVTLSAGDDPLWGGPVEVRFVELAGSGL